MLYENQNHPAINKVARDQSQISENQSKSDLSWTCTDIMSEEDLFCQAVKTELLLGSIPNFKG